MSRLRYNNLYGTTGASLSSGATTITFAAAPNIATIVSPDYLALELEPNTANYEIVHLTAYTSGQTTGTIVRAAEDASHWPAVAHSNGVNWSQAPTTNDFLGAGFNVKDFLARGDGVIVSDAAISSGSTSLTSQTASFSLSDVGKPVGVYGAGHATSNPDYGGLPTTIASFTDSHHVVLTAAASSSVTNTWMAYGTDDTASIQAALDAASAAGRGRVWLPPGIYITTSTLTMHAGVKLEGMGIGVSLIYKIGDPTNPVLLMGNGTGPLEYDMEIRSLTTAMVGPNQRGLGAGVYCHGKQFVIEDVEVGLPPKIGSVDNGSGGTMLVGATSLRYTVKVGGPPSVGDQLLIDVGSTGSSPSEVRTIASVSGTGPYTVGWATGTLFQHNPTQAYSMGYATTALGIVVTSDDTAWTAGPGVVRDCLVRNSIADAFFTANCEHVDIVGNTAQVTGDDAFSAHSGNSGGRNQSDTRFDNNTVEHAGASGFAIRGGYRIHVVNNIVVGSFGPAILLATGNGFLTLDTPQVENNIVRDCGLDLRPTYVVGPSGGALPSVVVGGIVGSTSGSSPGTSPLISLKICDNQIRSYRGPAICLCATDPNSNLYPYQVLGNVISGWVSGSLVTGQSDPGGGTTAAIYVERDALASGVPEISNNQFRSIRGEAIQVSVPPPNSTCTAPLLIQGNIMARLNSAGLPGITAIRCYTTGAVIVSSNELLDDQAKVTNFADLQGVGGTSAILNNLTAGLPILNPGKVGGYINAHLLSKSGQPSLGSLQSGISSQSIASDSDDVKMRLTLTTLGSQLAAGSIVAVVTFANGYNARPFIVCTQGNLSGTAVANFGHASESATGFSVVATSALSASTSYDIDVLIMGSS